MSLLVRSYTLEDWDDLLELQKAAFPHPFPENQLWNMDQIKAHIETFPDGAMVAVCDGVIAGSATALIIQHDGKPHTWVEVSDHGYIRNSHNPAGDSLYGIDVCVHPSFRNRGIAKALYEARKELVIRLNLTRFIACCRIPGYYRYVEKLNCENYVKLVVSGSIKDLVLSFMLKQNLVPIQIIDDYLDDAESQNKGVLVEWLNNNSENRTTRGD